MILEHTCLQLYLANIIIAKCQCLPDYMDDMAQELEKYDLRKEKVIKSIPDIWAKKSFDMIWKVGRHFLTWVTCHVTFFDTLIEERKRADSRVHFWGARILCRSTHRLIWGQDPKYKLNLYAVGIRNFQYCRASQ